MLSMLTYSYIKNEREILVFCVIVDMIILYYKRLNVVVIVVVVGVGVCAP
jgi:hypothetical protein